MTQTFKVEPSNGETNIGFGHSLSISDELVVGGAPSKGENFSANGSAYLFKIIIADDVANKHKECISIFPNPTTGIVNINCNIDIQNIKITDISGKTILEKAINQFNGFIDLTSYSGNIFILNVQTKQEIQNSILIKE
jgi:hypothetical protein